MTVRKPSAARLEKLRAKYESMLQHERNAHDRGYTLIAGVDEAGRGPLAGPVAAGVCILDPDYAILGLDDSKKLSPARRDQLYDEIVAHSLYHAVALVDEKTIDEINILEATKAAMRNAIESLPVRPDVLLIDALDLDRVDIPVVPLVKGDTLSVSIAAASILAKVTRDRLMVSCDEQYPGYGFAKHKGYGTAAHYDAIRQWGICPIHRKTFLKKFFTQMNNLL